MIKIGKLSGSWLKLEGKIKKEWTTGHFSICSNDALFSRRARQMTTRHMHCRSHAWLVEQSKTTPCHLQMPKTTPFHLQPFLLNKTRPSFVPLQFSFTFSLKIRPKSSPYALHSSFLPSWGKIINYFSFITLFLCIYLLEIIEEQKWVWWVFNVRIVKGFWIDLSRVLMYRHC